MRLELERVKAMKDATHVVCRDCGWSADICHPFWDISKLKWMHLNGSGEGHKVDWMALTEVDS